MDKSTETSDLSTWIGSKPSSLKDKATDTNDLSMWIGNNPSSLKGHTTGTGDVSMPLLSRQAQSDVHTKPRASTTIRISNFTLISCAVLMLALVMYLFLVQRSADSTKDSIDLISKNRNALYETKTEDEQVEFKDSWNTVDGGVSFGEVERFDKKVEAAAADDAQRAKDITSEYTPRKLRPDDAGDNDNIKHVEKNAQTHIFNKESKDDNTASIEDVRPANPNKNINNGSSSHRVDEEDKDKQDIKNVQTNGTKQSSQQTVEDVSTTTVEKSEVKIIRENSPKWMARYSWVLLNKIDVTISTDMRNCWITGVAVLDNNRLVVTDRINNNIKLMNTETGIIMADLQLKDAPWAIAKINESEIAVTCQYKVIFFEITDTISEKRTLTLDWSARGITYYKEKLIVTFEDPAKLQILDMSGKILTEVQPVYTGYPLFYEPRYVKVHPERGTIFVTDDMNGTLTEVNFDGTVRRAFAGSQLKYLAGLEIGPFGDVWVCEWTSMHSTIYSFKPGSYEFTSMLVTRPDALDNPYTLFYCDVSRRLYIGGYKSGVVYAYQLMD